MSENTELLTLLERLSEKAKFENSRIRGCNEYEYGGYRNDREIERCKNDKQRNTDRRGEQPPPKLKDSRRKEQKKYRRRVKNRKDKNKSNRLIKKILWEIIVKIILYGGLGLMTLCNTWIDKINIEIGNITHYNIINNFF